jgi:ubiquinone/menaquinone biosynthesis C-methylase UbiE
LDEMKRVLKPNGRIVIAEIDPNSRRGKWLRFLHRLVHGNIKFYEPLRLNEKVEDHGLKVLSINHTALAYFLTATTLQE